MPQEQRVLQAQVQRELPAREPVPVQQAQLLREQVQAADKSERIRGSVLPRTQDGDG